ncbi:AraC family transcriptional regulator [Mucilaginibacter sp. HD30]
MKTADDVADFYELHGQDKMNAGQFNVYRREDFACDSTSLPPNRRDFYKISLIVNGEGIVSSGDKAIKITGNAITFMAPLVPYSWEPLTDNQTGYFCLFTDDFVTRELKTESLSQSPLFKVGNNHIFFLDENKIKLLSGIFENMIAEASSSYIHKQDLLRSYVQIVMHEALKLDPPETYYQPVNALQKVTILFLELLERQFPVDSSARIVSLKNANEFAFQLNIHTNYLNRALKEITGKTTTRWIAERMVKEAKALLHQGRWDVAEISYCLGFDHPSNFHIFFKKNTGRTPLDYKRASVSNS